MYEGDGFEDEIDYDSVVSDRRHGGRLREARNQEYNNLTSLEFDFKVQKTQTITLLFSQLIFSASLFSLDNER